MSGKAPGKQLALWSPSSQRNWDRSGFLKSSPPPTFSSRVLQVP
jgi:hypothetical protein